MLDYKLIEALAMVVEEGGFDRASKRLNLTQSAISQRVKLLEEEAGQILLTRSSPPEPTSAGRDFIRHYLKVKHLEEDLSLTAETDRGEKMNSISIALNADSLELWFIDAVESFLKKRPVTLDIRVDDQEETHKMLRNGEVAGCISSRRTPAQGCTSARIGAMVYRLVASPEFVRRYFPSGLTPESVLNAPLVIFNRKDNLQSDILGKIFSVPPKSFPAHYVPSTEKFAEFILKGFAYGVIPDEQSAKHLKSGALVDLAPDQSIVVDLYWHRWNLKSELLDKLTMALSSGRSYLS